jgi:acetyl esterase/lipase
MKRPMQSMTDHLHLRRTMARANSYMPIPKDVSIEDVDADGVPSQFVRVPGSRDDRVILYLHGGGFVTSSPKVHARLLGRFCRELGATGLMVEYRLAPEHPFPAGSDDCLSAYKWLLAEGHKAKNIVIAGDSAGGCLTLVTLIRIRDEGGPQPSCAVMLSPATDLARTGSSHTKNEEKDPVSVGKALDIVVETYIGGGTSKVDPLVSPLYADMHGLPPLLFHVGSTEMLRDDSVLAAEKAKAAGVDVTCKVWNEMPHVFQSLAFLPESKKALEHIKNFVQTKTNWYDP